MTTVREATFELLREHGMTTIFGNPGSTELPMLGAFPDDFRYVLGLQEAGRGGDGRRLRPGERPSHPRQPAHRARTSAMRVGGDLQRPGQQVAAADHRGPAGAPADHDARPTSPTATPSRRRSRTSSPVPRAAAGRQDVPLALARAIHHATLPPAGPAFVSIPMDDWHERDRRVDFSRQLARSVDGRARPDPAPLGGPRRRAAGRAQPRARSPARTSTPQAAGMPRSSWSSKQRLPVWATPATGGGRLGFPEDHPNFLGSPATGDRPAGRAAEPTTTWCSWWAPRCSPTTPTSPGRCCRRGRALVAITSDPAEAARAPMGDGDRRRRRAGAASGCWIAARDRSEARAPAPREAPRGASSRATRSAARRRCRSLAEVWPQDGIAVRRVPLEHGRAAQPLRLSQPGQLLLLRQRRARLRDRRLGRRPARPTRASGRVRPRRGLGPVRDHGAVDGQPPTRVPVTFLVLRNEEYMILKWFAELEQRHAARRARPHGPRRGRVGARPTGSPPSRSPSARGAGRRRCARRSPCEDGPRLVAGAGRDRHVARLERRDRGSRVSALGTDTQAGSSRPRGSAVSDRAPDWVARARPSRCAASCDGALGAGRRSRARSTSSATPPTPARTARSRAAVAIPRDLADVANGARAGAPQRDPDRLPRRRHEPQRPGPDRRHPDRRPPLASRAPAWRTAARAYGPSRASLLGRLEPHARSATASRRARPRQHRHRLRGRRGRQQLRRDALRRARRLLQHGQRR